MKLSDFSSQVHYEMRFLQTDDVWRNKIANAARIYRLEVFMVEKKHREAATIHYGQNELEARQAELKKKGLVFTPLKWVKSQQGFAHYHVATHRDDPEAMCYGVVTRSQKEGECFFLASESGRTDHETIGKMLGFPDCCRQFFKETFCRGYQDTIWQQALNTKGASVVRTQMVKGSTVHEITLKGYPECVAHQRYWGVRVGFHLPCSYTCEATREWAQIWLTEQSKIDPTVAQDTLDILSLPATWAAYQGAAKIYTPHYECITNSVSCLDVHTVHFEVL
jgi:hypothetical protein